VIQLIFLLIGRLWITANNVYFLSEEQKTHVLLRIHDIIELSVKSLTHGSNDSIELSTSKSKVRTFGSPINSIVWELVY